MTREGLIERVTFELILSDNKGQETKIWWQGLLGRGKTNYRLPEGTGFFPVGLRHPKGRPGNEQGGKQVLQTVVGGTMRA